MELSKLIDSYLPSEPPPAFTSGVAVNGVVFDRQMWAALVNSSHERRNSDPDARAPVRKRDWIDMVSRWTQIESRRQFEIDRLPSAKRASAAQGEVERIQRDLLYFSDNKGALRV